MKISAALALVFVGGASAYSVSRSSIRTLGKKTVGTTSGRNVGASLKMEDFGLMKGSGYGFDDLWEGEQCISEVGLENRLNEDGLRYKMNKTPVEASACEPLFGLPTIELNLPLIGQTKIGPPRVDSIWEALGFTATSNNEARQQVKLEAIEKARLGDTEGTRAKWLEQYGYPRLVGSNGIFYADQLSSDKEPMGGFNMGKSGSIWPVPENIAAGQYGGSKGWGMKAKGRAVDNLPSVDV